MRFKKFGAITGASGLILALAAIRATGDGVRRPRGGPADSPAGWWSYTGVDAVFVADKLSANGRGSPTSRSRAARR